MKLVEIRQEDELQTLRSAWNTLLQQSSSNTIFLSWEWISAWWASYGKPGELRVLAVWDEQGALRGIAPLRCQTLRNYGQRVSALSFIGDGSNDSDYLDFIAAVGYEQQVMEAFRGHWSAELGRGTILLLNEIPENSPHSPFLKRFSECPDMVSTETEVPCGTVQLPRSWPDYLSKLRPRFRTKVRSVLRNLESRPEVRFGFCEKPEHVDRLLPILFDLHTRRWAEDAKPGVFGWDRKRDFYFALSMSMLKRGWLRFSWLEWNQQILACQYGFRYGDTYFHLQEGYEPACEHLNVGIGLRAWSIRESLKEGLREYDFLAGVGRHKTDWGAETKHSKRFLLARRSYKSLLFCRGPEWKDRAKESVKKFIPEKILADRRARLEQKNIAAFRQRKNGNHTGSWHSLQNAVANCYFHLRLPALVRPVREKYQLAIRHNGSRPKISWGRRTEPCARILYYHRVNDEGDPFFPAISTALFEQQIRFVTAHYKIVSLAELLDRLKVGSSEPVMAITFDDGYQDNYWNAYPILQRYGLPATIFLTTGSIDSREPLWFEQLAEAVKKTVREFVELEIDLPRRFWLRTPQERLGSNNRIFALLRGLPDSERRQWLAEILRLLAVPGDGERNDKMLRWEQVRLMKEHGIDFGGHTVTHPFLSRMTSEQMEWEVSKCKARIEEELQSPVNFFAYPNGREEDFGKWNKEALGSAGYRAAVTTLWGMNYRWTDPMELRRGGPWEQTQALFATKLDWYQLVNG